MSETQKDNEDLLVTAAKAIGTAAGKIQSLVEGGSPAPQKSSAVGKLPKKDKSRLPRKQKKLNQKLAQARSAQH